MEEIGTGKRRFETEREVFETEEIGTGKRKFETGESETEGEDWQWKSMEEP